MDSLKISAFPETALRAVFTYPERELQGNMGFYSLSSAGGWALIGIYKTFSEDWALAGLLFYIFLFILPGFAAASIGAMLYTRSRKE